MVTSHGKQFVGTTQSASMSHPFVEAPPPHRKGIIVGRTALLKRPVRVDPFGAKSDEDAFSAKYSVEGEVGSGKSALMKAIVRRLMRLKAFDGIDDGAPPVPMRLRIADTKMGEYQELTEALGSSLIRYGKNHRFNPFDRRLNMGLAHTIDIAVELAADAKKAPLDGYEIYAVIVGVHYMMNDHAHLPSIERLSFTINSITKVELLEYYESIHGETLGKMAEDSKTDAMYIRMIELAKETGNIGNINFVDFMNAAGNVATYLSVLTHGTYGDALGGEGSTFDELTQRVTTILWEDSNEKARDVIEGVHYKWRTISKYHPELIGVIPHLEVGDEGHKDNPLKLKFESEASRETRAYHTAKFAATQYGSTDTEILGRGDPALKAMADGIKNATSGRFVFMQPPNDPRVIEDLVREGFSISDAKRTLTLPKGWCAFKVRNKPVTWMRVILPESDRKITYTNQQNDKMVSNRRPADEDPVWRERARALGLNVDEPEMSA